MDRQGSGTRVAAMNRHRLPGLLLSGLLCITLSVHAANFEEGFTAYRDGNLDLARTTWEAAAETGDSRSMFSLGSLYMRGKGVPQDPSAGYKWFLRAAEAGLPQAQYNIAFMLEQGNGVEADPKEAMTWYQRAARAGLPQAQAAYASRLWDGRGIEADPAKALRWFEAAARQGHPEAQNSLGTMLENGIGTAADPAQAARWYERAATQGVRDAQASLARLYREGRGVEANGKRSEYWRARARGEREDEAPPGSTPATPVTPPVAKTEKSEMPEATKPVVASAPPATRPPVAEKKVVAASAPATRPPAEEEKITTPSASPATEAPGKSETVSSTAKVGSQRPEPEPLVGTAPGKPAFVANATPPKEPKRQPPADVTATDTPASWFDAAPTNHFTAQLIGSRYPDSLERFVSKNGLSDGAELLRTRRNGADWFIIVYGDFPDRGAAKIGIDRLPAAARKNKPWVRTIGEVRKLLARD